MTRKLNYTIIMTRYFVNKETARRYRSCSFRFKIRRQHSLQV